jgi:hypothetical protein
MDEMLKKKVAKKNENYIQIKLMNEKLGKKDEKMR